MPSSPTLITGLGPLVIKPFNLNHFLVVDIRIRIRDNLLILLILTKVKVSRYERVT